MIPKIATKTSLRGYDSPMVNGCRVRHCKTLRGRHMSNTTSQLTQALALRKDIDESIESLSKWLDETSPADSEEPLADASRHERLAWHYGYLIALRDVRELLAAA